MENQGAEPQNYEDVQRSGYLRKHKSMHRRFFVLRAASERGPARLEYYENEKKFRSKSPVPKKVLNLETCFNINKRADSKNKHLIVLYTRSESFAVAADSEEVQNEWYRAMLDLQCNCRSPEDYGSSGECSSPSPIPTFKEVWQVKVWPKGLGHARNLVGIYRLCLTDKTVNFVKLNSDVAAVVLQLMNVRRCGHSENFFFIEVGRSAVTGPGEFWMQVDDSVVAQNMHETLLEAMKALSEEFRQRSKSQSVGTSCGGGTASNPISVPSRRHHPNLPPSQVGFTRRARTETPGGSSTGTSPTSRHGFPRARTASIGARSEESAASTRSTWASSSPSLNGSCSTTPTLRPKPTRAPTPAKITLSLARYTPNPAPSPAPSLSSSSGHGSECGLVGAAAAAAAGAMTVCSYPRVSQRVSVSGSPSDYGSSDEYGSSPGEHSLLTPGMAAHHGHGEGPSSYIVMGQREGFFGSHHRSKGRRILRRSSSRDSEAERRLLSKRASLPLATHERLASHRKEDDEDDEYAIMSRSGSREGGGGGGGAAVAFGRRDMAGENGKRREADARAPSDSGYMAMLPGVTSPAADDEYMAMTPSSSVSPPRHMRRPGSEGYMVMSPNSCVPTESHGTPTWDGRLSGESRVAGDYVNVSPVSSRSACGTPPSHPEQHQLQPKMFNSYFSLPRAYQHTLYSRFEEDLKKGEGAGMSGPSKRNKAGVAPAGDFQLSMSSSSFSSSSASSESLEDKCASAGKALSLYRSAGTCAKDGRHLQKRASGCKSPKPQRRGRPLATSSDMAKANTLPRVKENVPPAAPHHVGDYVSIVFEEDAKFNGTHGTLQPANQNRPLLVPDNAADLPRSFSAPSAASADYVGKSSTPRSPPRAPRDAAPESRAEHAAPSPLVADANPPKGKPPPDPLRLFIGKNISDPGLSARPATGSGPPVPMEEDAGLGFSSRSPQHSSRRVRTDAQGRLGRRSETFDSPPSATDIFPESGQPAGHRRNLDCPQRESGPAAGSSDAPPPQASSEPGLNYIDIDLAVKESPQGGAERSSAAYDVGAGASAGLNTYASIDFYKSEELRAHHIGRKEDQDC